MTSPYKTTGVAVPTQAVWPLPAYYYFGPSSADYSGIEAGLHAAEEVATLGVLVGADSAAIGPEARGPLSTTTIALWGAVAFVGAAMFYGIVR